MCGNILPGPFPDMLCEFRLPPAGCGKDHPTARDLQAADTPSVYVSTLNPVELSPLSQTGHVSFSLAYPLHEGYPTIRELITGHKNVLCSVQHLL